MSTTVLMKLSDIFTIHKMEDGSYVVQAEHYDRTPMTVELSRRDIRRLATQLYNLTTR